MLVMFSWDRPGCGDHGGPFTVDPIGAHSFDHFQSDVSESAILQVWKAQLFRKKEIWKTL